MATATSGTERERGGAAAHTAAAIGRAGRPSSRRAILLDGTSIGVCILYSQTGLTSHPAAAAAAGAAMETTPVTHCVACTLIYCLILYLYFI